MAELGAAAVVGVVDEGCGACEGWPVISPYGWRDWT